MQEACDPRRGLGLVTWVSIVRLVKKKEKMNTGYLWTVFYPADFGLGREEGRTLRYLKGKHSAALITLYEEWAPFLVLAIIAD